MAATHQSKTARSTTMMGNVVKLSSALFKKGKIKKFAQLQQNCPLNVNQLYHNLKLYIYVVSLHLLSLQFFQENALTTSTGKSSLRETPNLDFGLNRKHLMFRNKQTPGDQIFENEKSSDNLRQTENSLIALVPAPLWGLAG